eukprot:TRINITY_DN7336_c0_g1_i1.p1 TRINITY_DN7336_c0_g1~~TRINITY_DN7336_c0_g1_i1.p1  ORF type:complete len:422 (+),score=89.71 TRINITY_DN7336_c0_g1_i1:65-1330(+)
MSKEGSNYARKRTLHDFRKEGDASALPSNGKKTKGRVKIKMEFIDNKLRRYTTFSKRKTGIMKKAYELSTLTGTQVMLLVASETGHVYTFATKKLQPMITSDAGKALIQTCLNSPDEGDAREEGDQRMCAEGFEETEIVYTVENKERWGNVEDDGVKLNSDTLNMYDERGSDDDDELDADDTNDTDLPTNLSMNARVPDRDNPPPPPQSTALQDSFKTNDKTPYSVLSEFLPISSRSLGGVAENLSITSSSDPPAVASNTNISELPSALALDTRKLLTLLPASDQIKRLPPDERTADSNLVFQTTTTTTTTAHLSPEVMAQLGYTNLLAQANQRAHNNQLPTAALLHEISKTPPVAAPTSRLPQLKSEMTRRHLQSQGAIQLPSGLACFVPDARTREALIATHMMASEQSPENLSLHDKNS